MTDPLDHMGAYPQHAMRGLDDRCIATYGEGPVESFERRCQLFRHDDDQHVACTRFEHVSPKRGMAVEFVRWGAPWTKAEPGEGILPWAPGFPGAQETLRGPDTP